MRATAWKRAELISGIVGERLAMSRMGSLADIAKTGIHVHFAPKSGLAAGIASPLPKRTALNVAAGALRLNRPTIDQAHMISERRRRERELAPEIGRRQRSQLRHAKRIVDLWNKRAAAGRRT